MSLVRNPAESRSVVELHWASVEENTPPFVEAPKQHTQSVWDRAHRTSLLDVPVWRMAPGDERACLALHAFKHLTMHGQGLSLRVSMLADLARHTAEGPSVEDGALAQRMQALGPNDVCSPLRALWVQGLGGTPGELLPDAAVATTPWPARAWKQVLVSFPLVLGEPGRSDDRQRLYGDRLRRILLHTALLHRWRDRLGLLHRTVGTRLWTVNEHDRRLVPGGSHWPALALLPVRWMRLLVRVLRD
jgi:hypothetical protein